MFNGVGWAEVAVLLIIGLFVFGPDKLPRVARDAGRMLRQLRQMLNGMRDDLRQELGPELADLDIRDLHPKTFVRKHLLEDDDPIFPSYLDKRTNGYDSTAASSAGPSLTKDRAPAASAPKAAAQPKRAVPAPASPSPGATSSAPWDTDAT
ncbi:MAG: Sec-independent protein translocase protein TatB [Frankia sp.]|nr:Sec-independent protein translocase protein TatB [Frankia sp.]